MPNQRPVVELVGLPPDTTGRYSYVMRFHWTAFDPDGEVDHFLYSIDPPASGDTTWSSTRESSGTFTFTVDRVDSSSFGAVNTATRLHTFVIKAVDAQGLDSAPDWRSFNAFTIAPSVHITHPTPSNLLFPRVPPGVTITWTGVDDDGPDKKPAKYKYILLHSGDPYVDFTDLSKLNRYGPQFAGWDSVSSDTTSKLYESLQPEQRYIFIVTAIDRAGAWDPVFDQRTNVLVFNVSYGNQLGPIITMFNQYFNFTYPSGGFNKDYRPVQVEVPMDLPVTIYWSAKPTGGDYIKQYRWAVDIADLDDPTPRSDEATDLQHWSHWSGNTTQATFGPYSPSPDQYIENHTFFLEAEDNVGLQSLGIAEIAAIRPRFDRPLLIVDDRRGLPDRFTAGHVGLPPGAWPSEAELDTFFFARGGFPWQGYGPENGLPTQLLSPPGLFLGYDYDTLDTRNGLNATIPLSSLAHYTHMIWYTDHNSADMAGEPYDPLVPITSLRAMTSPGGFNNITVFLRDGGQLLMFGGGIVSATLRGWGDNDVDFKATGPSPTLIPGIFPYDVLHMRADVHQAQATQIQPSPRRPAMFSALTMLNHRNTADPLPPLRQNVPSFVWVETVVSPLSVIEDIDPSPDRADSVSVLDTLYVAAGGNAYGPAGFYYHGTENPPVVYLGFDLWMWRRSQLIQTIDFFLQSLWGLPREPLPREASLTATRTKIEGR